MSKYGVFLVRIFPYSVRIHSFHTVSIKHNDRENLKRVLENKSTLKREAATRNVQWKKRKAPVLESLFNLWTTASKKRVSAVYFLYFVFTQIRNDVLFGENYLAHLIVLIPKALLASHIFVKKLVYPLSHCWTRWFRWLFTPVLPLFSEDLYEVFHVLVEKVINVLYY